MPDQKTLVLSTDPDGCPEHVNEALGKLKNKDLAYAIEPVMESEGFAGPSLDLPQDRRTTNGEILIRKSWRDGGACK